MKLGQAVSSSSALSLLPVICIPPASCLPFFRFIFCKVIYACNVADSDLAEGNAMVDGVRKFAEEEGARVVIVSAQVESELVDLDGEDKQEFLESLGEAFLFCTLGVDDRVLVFVS